MNDNTLQWNWRKYFSKANLEYGQLDAAFGKLDEFECDPAGSWAKCTTSGGFLTQVHNAPTTYEELVNYPAWTSLKTGKYAYGPYAFSNYYSCTCSQGVTGQRCRHLSSLMFNWERVHGPFIMTESEEVRAARIEAEKARQAEERRQKRLLEEMQAKQENTFPAIDYILPKVSKAPKGLFFRPESILRKSELLTDQYETEQADEFIASNADPDMELRTVFMDGHKQMLEAIGQYEDKNVHIVISQDMIEKLECDCGRAHLRSYHYWYGSWERQGRMCCHTLALWMTLRDTIVQENPGDETDYQGIQFLSLMTSGNVLQKNAPAISAEPVHKKRACVTLVPRITREKNSSALKLNFDIGHMGERCFAVKGLEGLVSAVDSEKQYSVSKTVTLDFANETFSEEAANWFQLILSRLRAVRSVNAKLSHSYYSSSTLSVGTGIPLEESDLDIVYDMAEGGSILYQYGTRSEVCSVPVGKAYPKAEIKLDPIMAGKRLTSIAITGSMPRLLRGSLHQYILDKTCFGRVMADEVSFLTSMQAIADPSGSFRCSIGEKKLAEFYYRVMPALQSNPNITIIDNIGNLIDGLVPPEPQFTFYLDLDGLITCDTRISYDDVRFKLGDDQIPLSTKQRDIDQEQRVSLVVRHFFPDVDYEEKVLTCPCDDEHLVWIMTDGIDTLSKYGEVKGSDAFKRIHIKPAPQPRISVQVEGGLIDLSIKTKDMTDDELLELLASYRQRKRWHRLKSGDFIDLSDPTALAELDETAKAMDVSIEDLVHGAVQMPKYRALYVDRLLEDHNEIATSRDRQFKGLIRSFQTIKDSDFEASDTLMDVLRPYQLYGFRWLSTLSQAGFGGILADEMGLGKTVQTLAFIQMQKQHGETKPSLVVCPASLVYNWKEECRKFTPDLMVETLAGNLRQRKALLSDMTADLYITSYDLLKRDIALYDGLSFSVIVLDEAQYIKNQRAAVSKAVRVLKADHRFALTGTPIENRLSELWSIFDFLMPGFLYSAPEFASRFEGPIMKQKDTEMTAKLARMTEPFILRRKKTDVLKDLPEKLEETRSSEMDEDQRQLYDAQLVRMKMLLDSAGDRGEDKMRILAEITRLRQICCDPRLLFDNYSGTSAKRAACLDLIQSAIDGGHRMLVFSQFTSMLDLLAQDLKEADIPFFTLTGSTSKLERIRLVNAFNEGDTPVFLISLKAGGTGLNLTGADVVIHYDPWWNLAVQNQATDRAHRIGQTKQVTVMKLIAAGTIEEKIVELQETKRELADAIISGENTSLMSLSREELMDLLE